MSKFIDRFKTFRFRGTAVLFLVFIILLAFVLIFEKNRPTKTDEPGIEKAESFIVWDIGKNDIQKININLENEAWEIIKEEQKCEKNDDKCKNGIKWLVKKPKEFEAKKEKIDGLLDEFSKLEGEKKITPDNLKDFGLDKPKSKLKLTMKDDIIYELQFGSDNPENTKVYAKRGDGNYVFLLEPSLKANLEIKEDVIKK